MFIIIKIVNLIRKEKRKFIKVVIEKNMKGHRKTVAQTKEMTLVEQLTEHQSV